MPAAIASMAANEQGKFWEYHDKLFANQQHLTRDDFIRYARELGLDVARFTAALDAGKHRDAIEADAREAAAIGVNGTPAFFVNGRYLSGAKPFPEFAKVINEELQKRGQPIPPGAQAPG